MTEDVYLALPDRDREDLGRLGITARDATPAYVFPRKAAARKDPTAFLESCDLAHWDAFRAYANSPEIRRLRYVGFRLAKKEPPSLDVFDVFIPPDARERRHLERTPLLDLLVAKHEAGLFKRAERAKGGVQDIPWKRLGEHFSAPRRLVEMLSAHRSVLVLGDPGSGKTTIVRWLAVAAAGGRNAMRRAVGVAERLLPVPVSVGRLADVYGLMGGGVSVPSALGRYFHDRSVGDAEELGVFLEHRLTDGECLVLLDGLDEVKAAERDAIRGWLEAFVAQYPRNRLVVTARILGFAGFDIREAVQLVLDPFTDEQVGRFVRTFEREYRRWETGVQDTDAAERSATELLSVISANDRLKALARSPFLLSALALVHRAEGRLPRHRVQIYETFARALCETWEAVRRLVAADQKPDVLYEEEGLPVLGTLAIRMHEEWPAGGAPEAFVVDGLAAGLEKYRGVNPKEAERVARQFLARVGDEVQILLERGAGQWGFLHLTFQEFFAAAGLHALEQFEDAALRHLFDPRWREVIRLGVAYLAVVQKRPEAARRVVQRVLNHQESGGRAWLTDVLRKQVPLAAVLATEAGDALPPPQRQEVFESLVTWLDEAPGTGRQDVVTDLAWTSYREALIDHALTYLAAPDKRRRCLGLDLLQFLQAEESIPAVESALRDEDPAVRSDAARVLTALGATRSTKALIDALADPDLRVRGVAAYALWSLRAMAAAEPLLAALRKSSHILERRAYAFALGPLAADKAVAVLIDDLKNEGWPTFSIRGTDAALEELGEAAVGPLLSLMDQRDPRLRKAAVLVAGTIRPMTMEVQLRGLLTDEDPWVRLRAANALIADPSAAAGVLEPLLYHAGGLVRIEALNALGSGRRRWWPPIAGVLSGVLARHEDPEMRANAASHLARCGADKAAGPLLAALDDPDPDVRSAAAEALGFLRHVDAVVPLLELRQRHAAENGWAALNALWRLSENPAAVSPVD